MQYRGLIAGKGSSQKKSVHAIMPGQIQPRTSKELKDKEEENDPPAKADSKKKAKKGIHQSLLLTPSLPTNPELDVVNEDDLT